MHLLLFPDTEMLLWVKISHHVMCLLSGTEPSCIHVDLISYKDRTQRTPYLLVIIPSNKMRETVFLKKKKKKFRVPKDITTLFFSNGDCAG